MLVWGSCGHFLQGRATQSRRPYTIFQLCLAYNNLYPNQLTLCGFNRAEREVVLSNVETFCNVALGEKVAEDFLLARDVVITISSITDHVRVSPIIS